MKIIFIASIYRHFTAFHIPYLKYFQSKGYEVWTAGMGKEDRAALEQMNIKCVDIPFSRSPLSFQNVTALKELKKLFETEKFDLVHVHTPVASLLTRMAFRKSKHGKLIYTAHGFHFYEGAPKQNWLIYYTAEKLAAKWTDHLITINEEDYKNAHRLLSTEKISLVHGVGVDLSVQSTVDEERQKMKEQLGLSNESIVISYVAELNENKNQQFLLRNWQTIKQKNPNFELLFIGAGEKETVLKKLVEENELKGIHFLGFRRDVPKLLQISDIVTLLSHREGLPRSIMEAMAEGIPCVVTNTRGLRDLVQSGKNGFVVNHEANNELIDAFSALYEKEKRSIMGENARQLVQPFLIENVLEEYIEVYDKVLEKR